MKTETFSQFARKNLIPDDSLCEAIERALKGLIDADLGGGVIKQRIARREGKSSGFRVIIVIRVEDRAVFLHGFAKKDTANVTDKHLQGLKQLAKSILNFSAAQLTGLVSNGALIEVKCNGEEIS